ncbi:MAG TPA: U32 family peptidase [Spirochaetota bacterium]|nr:U32 family peptidase [Spirochaetota bacterium]HPC39762.1 U32 family peptidase [Spirochaetota bacterium]HPL19320.1 U32 family peptidase [Spirochaetota bacterium]HQF07490.1 U32 family peptidase [Spirochaetota bacterium]HQH96750.1 U32 family peptidase [Spirochaetota bacterium]
MLNHNKQFPEIVSPAGNLEKLKFAAIYGADAVYFGGSEHNLRAQSDNFSRQDIEEGVRFCHNHGAKAVFLLNSFLHEKEIEDAKRFIDGVRALPFNAVMVSDPGMMALVRDAGMTCDIHLSTQMSTLNHLAVRFWHKAGVSRIVLAREATVDEIRIIRDNTDAEIEVFVHGALCIAYSGRCLLSRYLTGRDANRGDCAQACRWRYSLVEESRPGEPLDIIEDRRGTEILSSKDLCLVGRIGAYMEAGVDAFKIEGRMKSVYYTANTTRIYRDAVRTAGTPEFEQRLPFYREELDLVSHRPYTDDLFNEFGNKCFSGIPYINRAMFLGYRSGSSPEGMPLIRTFNPVYRGETVEAIFPITDTITDRRFTVRDIIDADGVSVDMARPNSLYTIIFDAEMGDYAILRRRR